jgi:ketosteroid isomerase-like protein
MTDQGQIERLLDTYASALDSRDYDKIAACFSPDAIIAYSELGRTLKGLDDIAAYTMDVLAPWDVSQHLFTNFQIESGSDIGRVNCCILANMRRRRELTSHKCLAAGEYSVGVRRTDGKWRITRLAARTLWGDGRQIMIPRSGRLKVKA